MIDFKIRTEDLRDEDILELYVETQKDQRIIESLVSSNPIILEGSRGTGKSFLLRVAEVKTRNDFEKNRILPIYLSFIKSSLLSTSDPQQFQHWMLGRLCNKLLRELWKNDLALTPRGMKILSGNDEFSTPSTTRIEALVKKYEESYKTPGVQVDSSIVPTVEDFKDVIEDLCQELNISRVVIYFDEVAHIFRPEQQREFFTLFRDLRSPHISCNAAVYPGATHYGETFQFPHDGTLMQLNRDVLESDYLEYMKEIVSKQADSDTMVSIEKNIENFHALAYAANGNPRVLLKTVAFCPTMTSTQVTKVFREFYRSGIWSEHTNLGEKYAGHKQLVDWGRNFIEAVVLPDTRRKNLQRREEGKNETTCYFWIHKDTPAAVKESLRILCYTGIVIIGESGIRATRSEIGTRYAVNLGCLASGDANPIKDILDIARKLSIKRFTEYGSNTVGFRELNNEAIVGASEPDMNEILRRQFEKPIEGLDITEYQITKLKEMGLNTVGKVLTSTEIHLQKIYYVGEKRARRIMNAATSSVLEYLSG